MDSRDKPRELMSFHWAPQQSPARVQQSVLALTHISLVNDAVAIVEETNPYILRSNGVRINLVCRIVIVEKQCTLLQV